MSWRSVMSDADTLVEYRDLSLNLGFVLDWVLMHVVAHGICSSLPRLIIRLGPSPRLDARLLEPISESNTLRVGAFWHGVHGDTFTVTTNVATTFLCTSTCGIEIVALPTPDGVKL